LIYYDFDSNTDRTIFENTIEQAVTTGNSALTRAGNTTAITDLPGAGIRNFGPATGRAIAGSDWQNAVADPGTAATDYFQFVLNTTGIADVTLGFQLQASATGPHSVGVLYSTDGGSSFTAAGITVLDSADVWRTGGFDLSAIPAVENAPAVTFRIYGYAGANGSFDNTGTLRIDNLQLYAASIVPGAGTITMLNMSAYAASNTGAITPPHPQASLTSSGGPSR
jgi:hypothetical protein